MKLSKGIKALNIIIQFNCRLLLLFCITTANLQAQDSQSPSLNLGNPAPTLRVREWIKGSPVQKFEKGKVYVIEFWATWCRPCILSMPHLSSLSHEYKGKVIIIGIDIYEKKNTPIKEIKAFVDSMGNRMDYNVAAGDSNFIETRWLKATGEQNNGIPRAFVVDAQGKLAWIGHPLELGTVLAKIVNNVWDIKEELSRRYENKRLEKLDLSLMDTLNTFIGNLYEGNFGRPDSALLLINEIVKQEPKLKYAPIIADNTFRSLLVTDPHKAYEYGKIAIITPTYEDPDYNSIPSVIDIYSNKLNLPAEIYELGAEAYQMKINKYGVFCNISNNYKNMAEMYWRANNKSKAIEAIQKAIEALKSEKNFSKKDLATFESRLQQYKNR